MTTTGGVVLNTVGSTAIILFILISPYDTITIDIVVILLYYYYYCSIIYY